MADNFDPDKYLADQQDSGEFDPDAYLSEPAASVSSKQDISQLESVLRGAGQGLTSGFSDEALAAIKSAPSLLDGVEAAKQEYEKQVKLEREANRLAQEANPLTYGGSELVGGVGSFVIPGLGVGKLAKNASLAQKAVSGATSGARIGALGAAGYSEAESLPELATDVAFGALLGAGTGAALPALGTSATKAGEFAKRKAVDVAAGAAIGGGIGAIAPGVDTGTGAVLGGATGLFTPARKMLPALDEILESYKLGKEGLTISGTKAQKEIQDSLEKSAKNIALKLKDKKDEASKMIGRAIEEQAESPVKGPEFVSNIENLLTEVKKTGSDDAVKAAQNLEKKLDTYKQTLKSYEVVKGPQVKSGLEEATEKLTKKTREEQLAAQALGEPVSVSPATLTPEQDYLTSIVRKTSPVGEDTVKPFVQKVENLFGERSLIDLKPVEIKKTLDNLPVDSVYEFRKTIQDFIQGTDDKFAKSQLRGVLGTVDNYIESSLSKEGKETLAKGKEQFSEIASLIKKLRPVSDITGKGGSLDELATKDLARKLSSPSKTGKSIRSVLSDRADVIGISEEIPELLKASKRAELASKVDDRSALSPSGVLGTVYAKALTGANIAGLSSSKLSSLADKTKNTQLSGMLKLAASLEGPAKSQLIRKISTSFDLSKELEGVDLSPIPSVQAQEAPNLPAPKVDESKSFLEDTKKLQKKALELKGTAVGNALNALAKETRVQVRDAMLLKLQEEYPELGLGDLRKADDAKVPKYMSDDDILGHLAISEGSALNAPSSRVLVPGATGVYDDGKGNPTTMFGANLKSPVTRKAYKDLGIDPLNATRDEHGKAAVYNWKLHARYSDKALDNMGLNLQGADPDKAQKAMFLLRDIGYRGGVKAFNSDRMAEMVQKLNSGDYRGFANDYIKTNHFQTGGKPRQQQLLKVLKELVKEAPGSGVYQPM